MKKLFQVFLSSTYVDLQDERREVLQTIIGLDCIPAGMELFTAADEEQFSYIRRVIDVCDYYIVIIGGRYGSLAQDGRSYTEKEFDYAVGKGVPILAFVRDNIDSLSGSDRDTDPATLSRLQAFREKVKTGRMTRPWSHKDQLPMLVFKSLSQAINDKPGIGWVRADAGASEETLNKLLALEEENRQLRKSIDELQIAYPKLNVPNLAPLESEIKLSISVSWGRDYSSSEKTYPSTFLQLFGLIGPKLYEHTNEETVGKVLGTRVIAATGRDPYSAEIVERDVETIRLQFIALGLIAVDSLATVSKRMALFWKLTEAGKALLLTIRTVKTA